MHPNRHAGLSRAAAFAACAIGLSAAAADPVIVSRSDPDFPREAVQAGADKGRVKARLTIDPSGEVTRVEIVEATPRRVFDRAVIRTLSQWRFNAGSGERHYEIDVDFKR